jgi:hypothetical protein
LIQTGILFPYYSQAVPRPPKTARIISGCTTSLIRGTRPILRKKKATPGELHHLHNHAEEIPGGTTAGINRQYDEIIISLANDESRLRQQLD